MKSSEPEGPLDLMRPLTEGGGCDGQIDGSAGPDTIIPVLLGFDVEAVKFLGSTGIVSLLVGVRVGLN